MLEVGLGNGSPIGESMGFPVLPHHGPGVTLAAFPSAGDTTGPFGAYPETAKARRPAARAGYCQEGAGSANSPLLAPSAVDTDDRHDALASSRGDGDAYARLVHRHHRTIVAAMGRFTRNQTQREELVNDVFVEAYLSLGSFEGQSPFEHWLRRIATRVGYRWWRHRARRRQEVLLSKRAWRHFTQEDERTNPLHAHETASVVHTVLRRLSLRDRQVLTLLHLREHSVEETARLTGWSRTMVKVQAHRARKRLGRLLSRESLFF